MAIENRAICPMCKTTFSVPKTSSGGTVTISCPNLKCRVRLEVILGCPVDQKAKWVGLAPCIERATV